MADTGVSVLIPTAGPSWIATLRATRGPFLFLAVGLVLVGMTMPLSALGGTGPLDWANDPPASVPLRSSERWSGIVLTGRSASYEAADTWYPSWATDGQLYSAFADGTVGSLHANAFGATATTGHARIAGDDPLQLSVEGLGLTEASALPYGGRYPSANLVHDGIWYHGTYALDALGGPCGNWCVLGPFVGFHVSTDLGQTWIDPPHTPARPLFAESDSPPARVRLGPLHFVDFGRNLEHSPDGKAYLVGHGSEHGDSPLTNWIAGDDVYLVRVMPGPDTINDRAAYEYYAGRRPDGRAVWSHDLADMRPLIEWKGQLGAVAITYDAPVGRYLMTVSRPSDGFDTLGAYDTFLLESEAVDGEWRLVHYLRGFGPQAYFVNVPSKFIAPDGLTFWLLYSANFGGAGPPNPPGSRYGLNLEEVRLRPGAVYVVAATRKQLVIRRLEDGAWTVTDALELPPGGVPSKPTVTSWGGDRIDVFVRAADGTLRHRVHQDGRWSDWSSLGGNLASAPDATSWGDGRIDVVARAPDHTLQHIWFTDGRWSAWEPLGGHLHGSPAITSRGPGRLDVFARSARGTLLHRALSDGDAWAEGWEDLGGRLVGAVDAVSPSADHIEVVARTRDGRVARTTYDGVTGWSPWETLRGRLLAGPSIAAWGARHVQVFGTTACPRGQMAAGCGRLVVRTYDGSWSRWRPLGGRASGVDAVAVP